MESVGGAEMNLVANLKQLLLITLALLLINPVMAQDKSPDSWLVKPPQKADSDESTANDTEEKKSPPSSEAEVPSAQPVTARTPAPVAASARPEKPKPAGFEDAVKLYRSGKIKQAMQKFEKFLKDGTADDESLQYLAASYQSQKLYGKALSQYDWLKTNARSMTMRRSADGAARTIRCYQKGICPANCLKLSMPGWSYQTLDGKKSDIRWIKFGYSAGTVAFSEHHLGELISYDKEGKAISKGKCPVCHGTGRVPKIK